MSILMILENMSQEHNHYISFPVIVFCHNESPCERDIKYYMSKYHRNSTPILIKIEDFINNTVDIPNFNYVIHNSNYMYVQVKRRLPLNANDFSL